MGRYRTIRIPYHYGEHPRVQAVIDAWIARPDGGSHSRDRATLAMHTFDPLGPIDRDAITRMFFGSVIRAAFPREGLEMGNCTWCSSALRQDGTCEWCTTTAPSLGLTQRH